MENLDALLAADRAHSWHPFTQMRDWCDPAEPPLVLTRGQGALLYDAHDRAYIDGNSSIWTNLHGHNHPTLNAAIRRQLDQVAHTSFLGFTHPTASELALALVQLWPTDTLTRVFFSDDGSTAIEAALKMTAQYWQLVRQPQRELFIAFEGAYHGDTFGASSLGGLGAFRDRFAHYHFPIARVSGLDELRALPASVHQSAAAVVIEPLIQGAAGMRLWPPGTLAGLREWCDEHGVLLIVDEIMTGFGRTGTMFACEQENVIPDLACLAKGLTGGYLPLAATLVREEIFAAFLGCYQDHRTFYYGHSYTANPLGCATALANLQIFEDEQTLARIRRITANLQSGLAPFREHPAIAEVRQCGTIVGLELQNRDGTPLNPDAQTGARVSLTARRHGLLTRPIRDVLVLMPPYCITDAQLEIALDALHASIDEMLPR